MNDIFKTLQQEFKANANPIIAAKQKAYMRGKFEYFGIKTPERRQIQKPFLIKTYLPPKVELDTIIRHLWQQPERDFHLFAQELLLKYTKQLEKDDLVLLEHLIVTNSWWDTVDFIAPKLVNAYFITFPDMRDITIDKWLKSGNIWLQRTCVIFQLLQKEKIDNQCLAFVINQLLGSKEFFINKAIGWALRDYSRTNPEWVVDFVSKTDLAPLSKREALRLIK